MNRNLYFLSLLILAVVLVVQANSQKANFGATQSKGSSFDSQIDQNASNMIAEGRRTFRFDTFGDEAFWGDTLHLHEAIKTVSPRTALSVGLKVDSKALSQETIDAIKNSQVNLDDPNVTFGSLSTDHSMK